MRSTLSFLLLFFSLLYSNAQNPEWISYTNGKSVGAIAVEDSIIWIGTDGGLVKLDTVTGTFTFYNRGNSGLPIHEVRAIVIDNDGNKWIGTHGGGIAKFDGVNWTVYNAQNSNLPSDNIRAMVVEANGDIWAGTAYSGLAKFDGSTWAKYTSSNSDLPSNSIWSLAIDEHGNKWIGASGGLTKLSGTTFTPIPISFPTNEKTVYAVATEPGAIWIGIWDYVAKFDGTNWTKYSYFAGTSITIDRFGHKWIGGSRGGISKFDGVNWTHHSGAPDGGVGSLALDQNNNLWVGGTFNGLAKYNGVNWKNYDPSNSGLVYNSISALATDNCDNVWIATFAGLMQFTGTTWIQQHNDETFSVAADSRGNIWTGTEHALLRHYDGSTWHAYNCPQLFYHTHAETVVIDDNDDKWLGTQNGLLFFDDSTWALYDTANSDLPDDFIQDIAIDTNGNKWIGTREGLAFFDGVNWTIYNIFNSFLPFNHVYSLAFEPNTGLWIGQKGMLTLFDGTTWTTYDPFNSPLPDFAIPSIVIDENRNKWIATSDGLFKFDGVDWSIYKRSNSGLNHNQVNVLAIDRNGNKWTGNMFGHGLGAFREGGVILNQPYLPTISGNLFSTVGNTEIYSTPHLTGSSYEWIVTNGTIQSGQGTATVEVLWDTAGAGTIAVRETNAACNSDTAFLAVDISPTGVQQVTTGSVVVYPNPVSATLHLSYSNPGNEPCSLQLYDISGKAALTIPAATENKTTIDVTGVAPGVYYLELITESNTLREKVIVVR